MILDVFDANFIRIANIKKYSYAQYELQLNGRGNFELKIAINSDALQLLSEGRYILFEIDVLSEITKVTIERNEENSEREIVIGGLLIKHILSYRCFIKTQNYTGTITEVERKFLSDNCILSEEATRKIPQIVLSEDATYIPITEVISVQETGGSIEDAIQSISDAHEMGYDLVPSIKNIVTEGDISTNISALEFRVIKGKDRTIGNTDGNNPVEFSFELKNLLSSEYIRSIIDYRNVAYVAGEGEGTERTVVSVGETALTGLERIELYVDARDLQSTDSDGNVLTTVQYQDILKARGFEKLAENVISETFTASINTNQVQFTYKEDYNIGDIVTIFDREVNLSISARITALTVTSMGNRDHLDITFGYQKLTSMQKLKRGGIL